MIIEYSIQDVLDLSHAVCRNFYTEQKDRFEIHKESKRVSCFKGVDNMISDDQAMMMFYETRLEALTAFKVLDQSYHAAMIWDLAGGQWAVVCSMTWKEYEKIAS
tara:strand:- start:83 stop:397 length:315 start_codon:yes stop_codon:yes gene_type:complete